MVKIFHKTEASFLFIDAQLGQQTKPHKQLHSSSCICNQDDQELSANYKVSKRDPFDNYYLLLLSDHRLATDNSTEKLSQQLHQLSYTAVIDMRCDKTIKGWGN